MEAEQRNAWAAPALRREKPRAGELWQLQRHHWVTGQRLKGREGMKELVGRPGAPTSALTESAGSPRDLGPHRQDSGDRAFPPSWDSARRGTC